MTPAQAPSVDLGDPRSWEGIVSGKVSLTAAIDSLGRSVVEAGASITSGPADLEGCYFLIRYSGERTRLYRMEPGTITDRTATLCDPLSGGRWDESLSELAEEMSGGYITIVPDSLADAITGVARAHAHDCALRFAETLAGEMNTAGM